MKSRPSILFLLLSLFVAVSANHAWACGSKDSNHAASFQEKPESKSCCANNSSQASAHCTENSGGCDVTHPGQSCPPDEDGCGGCHCPGCGLVSSSTAGSMLVELPVLPSMYESGHAKRQAFYFADHIPEAVYLPIWQPPKIGA